MAKALATVAYFANNASLLLTPEGNTQLLKKISPVGEESILRAAEFRYDTQKKAASFQLRFDDKPGFKKEMTRSEMQHFFDENFYTHVRALKTCLGLSPESTEKEEFNSIMQVGEDGNKYLNIINKVHAHFNPRNRFAIEEFVTIGYWSTILFHVAQSENPRSTAELLKNNVEKFNQNLKHEKRRTRKEEELTKIAEEAALTAATRAKINAELAAKEEAQKAEEAKKPKPYHIADEVKGRLQALETGAGKNDRKVALLKNAVEHLAASLNVKVAWQQALGDALINHSVLLHAAESFVHEGKDCTKAFWNEYKGKGEKVLEEEKRAHSKAFHAVMEEHKDEVETLLENAVAKHPGTLLLVSNLLRPPSDTQKTTDALLKDMGTDPVDDYAEVYEDPLRQQMHALINPGRSPD